MNSLVPVNGPDCPGFSCAIRTPTKFPSHSRFLLAPCLALSLIVGTPSVARAEPVTFTALVFTWLVNRGLDLVWDKVHQGPDVRAMRAKLDAIEVRDRQSADQIEIIRHTLDEKMSRSEVEALLMRSLARVDATLADHAERLRRAEKDIAELKRENGVLSRGLAEHRAESARRLEEQERRLRSHDADLADHEARLRNQEKRLRALEEIYGAGGFKLLSRGKLEDALESFEDGIVSDPSEPGYYFAKGLALHGLHRDKEAIRAVKTGIAAQRSRPVGNWYSTTVSRVQGSDRKWLENLRLEFGSVSQGE